MGMTWTHEVTGRQLPLVTVPASEFGDGSLHTVEPHLPGLTKAAKKFWKKKYRNAGRCSQLWKASEMGLEKKIHTGI